VGSIFIIVEIDLFIRLSNAANQWKKYSLKRWETYPYTTVEAKVKGSYSILADCRIKGNWASLGKTKGN
jgi:hypothetical protein